MSSEILLEVNKNVINQFDFIYDEDGKLTIYEDYDNDKVSSYKTIKEATSDIIKDAKELDISKAKWNNFN